MEHSQSMRQYLTSMILPKTISTRLLYILWMEVTNTINYINVPIKFLDMQRISLQMRHTLSSLSRKKIQDNLQIQVNVLNVSLASLLVTFVRFKVFIYLLHSCANLFLFIFLHSNVYSNVVQPSIYNTVFEC